MCSRLLTVPPLHHADVAHVMVEGLPEALGQTHLARHHGVEVHVLADRALHVEQELEAEVGVGHPGYGLAGNPGRVDLLKLPAVTLPLFVAPGVEPHGLFSTRPRMSPGMVWATG